MTNRIPFLDIKSFEMGETPLDVYESSASPAVTPFLALYETDTSGNLIAPETEETVAFLNELYDEEFDEALEALVNEAAAIFEANFANETGDPQSVGYRAERLLNQHFAPLAAEAEAMFEALAVEFSRRDPSALTEAEIDEIVDRYQPSEALTPAFEDLFGGLKKLAKKAVGAVKKVGKFAAKLGLGPILRKIKPLIKPLLKRVINAAIGKLPAYLQPVARKLAEKAPFLRELENDSPSGTEAAELSEIAHIQMEFNQQVAALLFAPSEIEQDLEIAQVLTETGAAETYPLAELSQARDQFVENLSNLREEEDPAPYVENFVPAILPALRIGIKLVGRKKVVNFLAKFLAKLIRRFVGPKYAPPLSQAIVDVGLRLLNLEVTQEEASQAGAAQVAAVVEETVRLVAEAPEYILEDQELLEAFTLEAFEHAAAAYLPPMLSEETYRQRPELGEARKLGGIWMNLPAGRGKRCKYKKLSRVLRKKLSPAQVAELETFEGDSLGEALEDQYGMAAGEEFEALIHLYEASADTRRLSDIARQEAQFFGTSGGGDAQALHPLTREAAGLLLDDPGLGREIENEQPLNPHAVAPGQRLYALEIPGRRRLAAPGAPGAAKARRSSRVRTILNFSMNEILMQVFLSEVRSQKLAAKMRQRTHNAQVVAGLVQMLRRGLRSALKKGNYGRLKIIHEAVTPGRYAGALRRLPARVPEMLIDRLVEWTTPALASHLKQRGDEFLKSAEDAAEGVTLLITLSNPPGFPQLREALKGKGLALAGLKLPQGSPVVKIRIVPGYQRGRV